jgi:hypothetical protein
MKIANVVIYLKQAGCRVVYDSSCGHETMGVTDEGRLSLMRGRRGTTGVLEATFQLLKMRRKRNVA